MARAKPNSIETKAAEQAFDAAVEYKAIGEAFVNGLGRATDTMIGALRTHGAALKSHGVKVNIPTFVKSETEPGKLVPAPDSLAANPLISAISVARAAAGDAGRYCQWLTVKRYMSGAHGLLAFINGESETFLHHQDHAAADENGNAQKSPAGKKLTSAMKRAMSGDVVGAELSGVVGTFATFVTAYSAFGIAPLAKDATQEQREAYYTQREAACRAGVKACADLYAK